MTPSEDSFGERSRRGHITQRGPSVVRWVLVEAADCAMCRCAGRIARGREDRRKEAMVATAHELAIIIFRRL
ncbi:MAG: transposase [Phycisphaerales bacterium]|nr:transposase [Phycisphaerales bacterium]